MSDPYAETDEWPTPDKWTFHEAQTGLTPPARTVDTGERFTPHWRTRGEQIATLQASIAQLEAEAAALVEERCCDAAYRDREEFGKYSVYTCADSERTCRTRLVGPWSE